MPFSPSPRIRGPLIAWLAAVALRYKTSRFGGLEGTDRSQAHQATDSECHAIRALSTRLGSCAEAPYAARIVSRLFTSTILTTFQLDFATRRRRLGGVRFDCGRQRWRRRMYPS